MATIFFLLLLAGFHTTMASDNWVATVSSRINGPTVDQLWPYLTDFCNCYKIYPSVASFCVQGTEGVPGLTRYIVYKSPSPSNANATIIQWVKEELIKIDANEKSVSHKMHENNKGLSNFSATVQLLDGDDKGCTFNWSVVCDPIVGISYDDFVAKLDETVAGVVSLIQSLFST